MPFVVCVLGQHDAVLGTVPVFFQACHALLENDSSPKATIDGGLVQDHSILNIVSRKRHDGNDSILPSRQPVEVDELDRLGLSQRSLRVHEEIQERVHALQLVVRNRANGLLAHSTLIRVAGRLVVMGIWNQARARAHDCQGIDFQMRRLGVYGVLVQDDHAVVLLVHVKVLNEPLLQEVGECTAVVSHLLDVLLGNERNPLLDYDERPTHSPPIA
mmetsp:Transcript_7315/g.18229  ORF Transcript_7315/g.18229 Transcript_7315/m.18229 type:complete len:216 (-) Transcript_7315:476-1123(-)